MKKHSDGSEEISGKVYQGLFLPPDMLKEYKEVDPELPGKIIKWTEEETRHRRSCEKKFLNYNFAMNLSSHLCALLAIGAILFVSYLFMSNGHALEGMWIALSIASVVGIFVIRKYMTEKNTREQTMPQKGANAHKKIN